VGSYFADRASKPRARFFSIQSESMQNVKNFLTISSRFCAVIGASFQDSRKRSSESIGGHGAERVVPEVIGEFLCGEPISQHHRIAQFHGFPGTHEPVRRLLDGHHGQRAIHSPFPDELASRFPIPQVARPADVFAKRSSLGRNWTAAGAVASSFGGMLAGCHVAAEKRKHISSVG